MNTTTRIPLNCPQLSRVFTLLYFIKIIIIVFLLIIYRHYRVQTHVGIRTDVCNENT